MQVEVRLFAWIRELVGRDRVILDLPRDATLAMLREQLLEQFPCLLPWKGVLLLAVDNRYAEGAMRISPESQIACFPPVGGG